MRIGLCLWIAALSLLCMGCMSEEDGEPVPMGIRRDELGTMGFEEARTSEYTPTRSANIGYDQAVYWLKLLLRSGTSGAYLIEVSPVLDHADAFIVSGDRVDARHTGSLLPYEARDVPTLSAVFHVRLSAGEPLVMYVRASSNNTIYLAPHLYSTETFAAIERSVGLGEGLFYGVLLAMVFFNLLLFVGLRDRVQLQYVIFQLGVIATEAAIDEMPARLGLPGGEHWGQYGEIVCVSIAAIGGVGFARTFLGTRETMPRGDRALVGIAIIAGILGLAGMFTVGQTIRQIGTGVVIMWSLAMFLVGVIAVRRRTRNAIFFLLGWSLMLVSILWALLRSMGIPSTGTFSSLAMFVATQRFGVALEAMIFALGLVVRVDRLRREKMMANEAVLTERAARAEALERLINGVAHEVGNPLNFIVGGAGALAGEVPKDNTRVARALGLVQQGAERMSRIIDNLRQYAQARDVPLDATRVDEEIAATLELVAARVKGQQIEVVRAIELVPGVQTRPGELGQVLSNLVSNACDAMPDGGTLRIACTNDGAMIDIIVADSGPGVPEDKRSNIFEPFFTTRDAGTGMGLAISAEIARRHGWELRVLERDDARGGGLGGAAFLLRMRL